MSRLHQPPDPAGADDPATGPAPSHGQGSTSLPGARSGADPTGAGADGEDVAAGQTPVGRLAATVERLRREVRAAQAEADGRALIELAKGILVERLGCGRRRPLGSWPS